MIAFQLEYTLEPERVDDFQHYARHFVELTKKYGGQHYGYFVNADKEKPTAIALFSFEDIERYDFYRKKILDDPQYEIAMDHAKKTRCIKCCYRNVYEHQVA